MASISERARGMARGLKPSMSPKPGQSSPGQSNPSQSKPSKSSKGVPFGSKPSDNTPVVDLKRRSDQLRAKVAEMQWDLGGLVYEMAIRDRIRVDVLVRRAAALQNVDAELGEVERILRLEQSSTAGQCASCGAPHSSGAAYCWQCGQPLLPQVASEAITTSHNSV